MIDWARTCFKCLTVLLTVQTSNGMVTMEISRGDLKTMTDRPNAEKAVRALPNKLLGGRRWHLQMEAFSFWMAIAYIRSRSKQTKTDTRSYCHWASHLQWNGRYVSVSQQRACLQITVTHTLLREKKPITACHKKSACVVCPVSKI